MKKKIIITGLIFLVILLALTVTASIDLIRSSSGEDPQFYFSNPLSIRAIDLDKENVNNAPDVIVDYRGLGYNVVYLEFNRFDEDDEITVSYDAYLFGNPLSHFEEKRSASESSVISMQE